MENALSKYQPRPEGNNKEIEQQQIRKNGNKQSEKPFAITKQQIFGCERSSPSDLLPALQANTQRPACLLLVSSPKRIGKIFTNAQRHRKRRYTLLPAAEHRAAAHYVLDRKFAKDLTHPASRQSGVNIIIFSQAVRVEWLIICSGRHIVKNIPMPTSLVLVRLYGWRQLA